MTRKCVLCKETNYRNSYSFFSAPKDPETRRKWQEAIGIDNYAVSDDTYVCSKHFHQNDIITHWVSGVPPHVITIKYKKCRLRPGAVPDLDLEMNDNTEDIDMDQYNEFKVNKETSSAPKREHTNNIKKVFTIPRTDENLDHDSTNYCNSSTIENENFLDTETYEPHYQGEIESSKSSSCKDSSQECTTFVLLEDLKEHEMEIVKEEYANVQELLYEENNGEDNILYIQGTSHHESGQSEPEMIEQSSSYSKASNRMTEYFSKESGIIIDDDTSTDIWDRDSRKHNSYAQNQPLKLVLSTKEDNVNDQILHNLDKDPLESHDGTEHSNGQIDIMLFEDLLEVYTEVALPRGWSFTVTSKGHGTTVVYLYMNVATNGVPFVEKQVYIKSDMVMRCGAVSKEVNPFIHNLVREGKELQVQTLSDIEELIEELDQRVVCEGSSSIEGFEEINSAVASRDGGKWRHKLCPVILNNGSTKCSKCSTLGNVLARCKSESNTDDASVTLLRKQRKINALQKMLRKLAKRNQRFEVMRANFKDRFRDLFSDPQKTFLNTIDSLNMPEIQKLMMKECLKASASESKKDVRYSETWVFLCLLLYVESPRMYRYMLLNNYMTLPSMRIVRRYLRQVKNDPQFYNLFQRTVEPFQPIEGEEDVKELT
ncbi:uncharacterized protein LOC107269474 [Cephus cinctus]|uniref:Uncharacterized protein LOC107269474 n=1 Tax=Cephus cinctus TaxID=211228 RepID=A0AAJ7C0I3_CEPCN|nr:uncharacterized protein LOC107269474 [Cephus cinctus]